MLANRSTSLQRLIRNLQGPDGEALSFVYESGPCGYGVYREIIETGHDCQVVALSLIPRKPGDRVKTDRRDAVSLAQLHRAGELTPVWVPGRDQEVVRDLTRARENMKAMELKGRQRLGAFLFYREPAGARATRVSHTRDSLGLGGHVAGRRVRRWRGALRVRSVFRPLSQRCVSPSS